MKSLASNKCVNCGEPGVNIRTITRSYGRGRNLLVIEGVPAITCPHCGESYFTPETVRQLEDIRRQKKLVAVPRTVRVATFDQANLAISQ
jgi:YgiT-type zinc finger domain-containing protein